MKFPFKTKNIKTLALGFFLLIILASSVYAATQLSSLKLVTDDYGYKFFMGNDPLAINTDSTGTLQMFIFANAPYPQVYFTASLNGQVLAEGYGTGKNNIVEFNVPIQGNNFSPGEYLITGTAQVSRTVNGETITNPAISNTVTLYIKDPVVSQPEPSTPTTPMPTSAPTAMLTINVYDTPINGAFNFISIFNENNEKIALTQTTPSQDSTYYYAKRTLPDQATYKVQVECAGYKTQIQTIQVNGETTVTFTMESLTMEEAEEDQGIIFGEMPTGELNQNIDPVQPENVEVEKSWLSQLWDQIVYVFTLQWL